MGYAAAPQRILRRWLIQFDRLKVCDGQYLFRLEVPYEYSDAQLEELVASVQPVEDIVPYLSTMTQQELEDAIG